jgi:UDP:flavonoid glycosyltransferase YjiC (YdhE family)
LSESETPPNFHVDDFLPGIRIMEICHLVICHGGNGTIYQALSKGVPVIGIPTMHDQEINMDRIVDLEMGIKLSKRRLDSQ